MVTVEIREWGHSLGVILPMSKLKMLGLRKGDKVDIDIIGKTRIDGFGICKGAAPLDHDTDHKI